MDGIAYIGMDTTTASLNAPNQSVVGLINVPGFRLTIDCEPIQPKRLAATEMGETFYYIGVIIESGDLCWAAIRGIMNVGLDKTENDNCLYTAFQPGFTSVSLGYLSGFNDSEYAVIIRFNLSGSIPYDRLSLPGHESYHHVSTRLVTPPYGAKRTRISTSKRISAGVVLVVPNTS